MQVVPPSGLLEAAYQKYLAANGVIDLLIVSCSSSDSLEEEGTHRQAVRLAISALKQRIDQDATKAEADWEARWPEENPGPSLPTAVFDSLRTWIGKLTGSVGQLREAPPPRTIKCFRMSIDHDKERALKGTLSARTEFVGQVTRHSLEVSGRSATSVSGEGLAWAFLHPPYGLRLRSNEADELFGEFVSSLLGGENPPTIFCWPTDWSNYFDAGREWWGSYLWSVARPESREIAVLAASTTD